MARFVREKVVEQCFHSCYFFNVDGHIMECKHPDFEGAPIGDSYIITQDNSRGRVPNKCPLRKDDVEIVMRIKLKI